MGVSGNARKPLFCLRKTDSCIYELSNPSLIAYDRVHIAPGNNNHEMGGARMGRNPETSVLNEWNQCHDIPNLFVTDGACMASSANQNPSLTYMALTARAVHYAVDQLKTASL